MDLLKWLGLTFAKWVALVVALLSASMLIAGLLSPDNELWVRIWMSISGACGIAGGITYFRSFGKSPVFATSKARWLGWFGLLIAVLFPTNLTVMLLPLVILVIPYWPLYRFAESDDSSE